VGRSQRWQIRAADRLTEGEPRLKLGAHPCDGVEVLAHACDQVGRRRLLPTPGQPPVGGALVEALDVELVDRDHLVAGLGERGRQVAVADLQHAGG
jgi:hypothetical protein